MGGDEDQEPDHGDQLKGQAPTRATHGHLQEALRRVSVINHHRGFIHGGDLSLHGVRTGCQPSADRDRGSDPRAPAPTSTLAETRSEGCEEGRAGEGLSEAPEQNPVCAPIKSNEQPLSNRIKKEVQFGFAVGFEKDWANVAYGNRLRLLEVCCSEDSVLSRTCDQMFGPGSAQRISKWNGGDIETKAGVEYVKSIVSDRRPELLWMSPECGPFSPMQHLNMRDDRQRTALTEKRQKAKKQYEAVCEIGRHAHSIGVPFVIELSERCEGWKLPMFTSLQQDLQCSAGVCKGCQVGLRNSNQELMGKGWRLMGTCKGLVQHMTLKCQGNHQHGSCEGSKNCQLSAFYTPQFAKRVMESLQRVNMCQNVVRELQGGVSFDVELNNVNHSDAGSCQHRDHEHDHHVFTISPERRSAIMQSLRRIHAATGHCSNEYLVRALKKRNADQDTVELAKQFRCPSCEEQKGPNPRNMANLEDIPPKWSRVQIDGGTWNHPETKEPFHFLLGVDEGSRFRMGMILKSGKKISLSGEDMITFFEERWKPIFGKPAVIRMDPAGGFRSEAVNQHFAEQKVLIEHIPGESHWQIPVVEKAIQTTKNMMSKLSLEFPEMSCREIFLKSIWAQNIRDQYMGFSPLQHAMGRNPDDYEHIHTEGLKDFPIITEKGLSAEFGNDQKSMQAAEECFLKEQYNQKLLRAQRSGSRKLAVFKPGDLVFYWRKQIGAHGAETKGQPFKTGAFLGPARVLATETRLDDTGQRRPGSSVWIFRGSNLFKASPQQLRHASEREEAWAELQEDHPIPWTISGILEQSKAKTYTDLTQEGIPEPEDEEDDPNMEVEPGPSSAPRIRYRRKGPDLEREEDPKCAKQMVATEVEEHALIGLASTTPSVHLQDPHGCIQVAVDLPHGKKREKEFWLRDLGAYVVNQTRKNHIEVSERKLSQQELEMFQQAKSKEVKNYIMAEVFKKLPDNVKPDPSQVIKMRWILTWKCDKDTGERKPKARAVILGYMDPLYEHRPTSSPTMTKSTKQLFLTLCAAYKYVVEKGDISGAFLQGRECQDEIYVAPLKEITDAMGLPENSITKLAKAAYGLVQAPLEFYLTVHEFLESLGFVRQQSDPCCWGLFDEQQQNIGWVTSHVDGFSFWWTRT